MNDLKEEELDNILGVEIQNLTNSIINASIALNTHPAIVLDEVLDMKYIGIRRTIEVFTEKLNIQNAVMKRLINQVSGLPWHLDESFIEQFSERSESNWINRCPLRKPLKIL